MTIRRPAVAGQFYQGSKAALEKEVARLMDRAAKKEACLGVLSPHAGYIYSGPVAGKTLSRIKFRDSFIILGPNHTGMGKPFAIISSGRWQMPMGDVEIDEDLASFILKNSKHIEEDATAHLYEHSVEVQLPFLQYVNKGLKFVPIIISDADLEMFRDIGKDLAEAVREYKKGVVIIASSDMTHYEPHETAKKKDRLAIDAILKLDEKALLNEIKREDISMCGYGPCIVMLSALKELGAKNAELVDYMTSGDTSGDYSAVVGYAGILIK